MTALMSNPAYLMMITMISRIGNGKPEAIAAKVYAVLPVTALQGQVAAILVVRTFLRVLTHCMIEIPFKERLKLVKARTIEINWQ